MTDGRVAVPSSNNRSGGKKVYHTTECLAYPSRPVLRRPESLGDGWSECAFCAGEVDPEARAPPDRSYYDSLVEAARDG